MSIQSYYLQTAAKLITSNNGSVPLHIYLKQFFSQHKKYGSRDRRQIASLCYAYYRLGKAFPETAVQEKIVIALFLLSDGPNNLLAALNKSYDDHAGESIIEKLKILGFSFSPDLIFPFTEELSNGIDPDSYAAHMFIQPDVFVRIRPGKFEAVINKLQDLGWDFMLESNEAIRLKPAAQVDKYFKLNEQLVIQDLNSQQVGYRIKGFFNTHNFIPTHLWDCCAASGGKSIMIHDLFPHLSLSVSDIRQSILHNLLKRFKEAGIKNYHAFVADLVTNETTDRVKPSNFIVTDVPCTGSGTWARTPEQLYFFKKESIADYAKKQYAIVNNAIKYLLPKGWLVYITCSVFKKENEEIVEKLLKKNDDLQLMHQEILNGTKQKADSMFIAIMQRAHR